MICEWLKISFPIALLTSIKIIIIMHPVYSLEFPSPPSTIIAEFEATDFPAFYQLGPVEGDSIRRKYW